MSTPEYSPEILWRNGSESPQRHNKPREPPHQYPHGKAARDITVFGPLQHGERTTTDTSCFTPTGPAGSNYKPGFGSTRDSAEEAQARKMTVARVRQLDGSTPGLRRS